MKRRWTRIPLTINAQEAAAVFIAAGTAANTVRSYRSALTYWSAWLQLRYGQALGDVPLPAAVAIQFVLDHLARPLADGSWAHLLPPTVDAVLVKARIKSKLGPLAFNTVSHRLAVLGKRHRINGWESPTEASALKTLLRYARKAQSRQGVTMRKKSAMVLEPLRDSQFRCLAARYRDGCTAPLRANPLCSYSSAILMKIWPDQGPNDGRNVGELHFCQAFRVIRLAGRDRKTNPKQMLVLTGVIAPR